MTHNWPVYGHDWAVEHLHKGMRNHRVRHAYLITGTDSIGKMTLALAFAMALNCTHEDESARPCGGCRSCKLTQSGNHPDMLYSQTDPRTGVLKIDAIRTITGRIAMKPYEARYRIAIFENFDHAQPRAQDALLKTLEEPPPNAVLILLAESTETVLSTITSRSQVLHLRPVAAGAIQAALAEVYAVEEEQAELLSRLSGGRIGWAIDAVENPDLLQQREDALALLEEVLGTNRTGRFDMANKLGRDKQSLLRLLELWQTYWRDVLLLAENSPVKPCNVDRSSEIRQLVETITPEEALDALRSTQELMKTLAYNVNARLALEVMFLDYPGLVR
jgi:DNA polymerase III subunit delta'